MNTLTRIKIWLVETKIYFWLTIKFSVRLSIIQWLIESCMIGGIDTYKKSIKLKDGTEISGYEPNDSVIYNLAELHKSLKYTHINRDIKSFLDYCRSLVDKKQQA